MKPANYAPVYACVYAQLAEVARQHGYALSIHGSLAADFDLVCIPWAKEVSEPQAVVDQITREFAIEQVAGYEQKEHGRIATTISFSFGECRLDLSFMPRADELARLNGKTVSEGLTEYVDRRNAIPAEQVMVPRELLERIANDDEGMADLSDFEELKRLLYP